MTFGSNRRLAAPECTNLDFGTNPPARRLRRVHKVLSKVGYALQYSIFAADLANWERTRLVGRLRRLIDEKEDDIRFYLVTIELRGAWHGPLPGRVLFALSGGPAATLARRLARLKKAE